MYSNQKGEGPHKSHQLKKEEEGKAKFNTCCSPHSSSFSTVEQEMGITVLFHQIHVMDRKAKFLI